MASREITPVGVPSDIEPEAFWRIVNSTYTGYLSSGKKPDIARIGALSGMKQAVVAKILVTPEFTEAMRLRGVNWEGKNGLTTDQHLTILKLADASDRRSLGGKLRELGIPMSRYQAWLKQPLFKELTMETAERVFHDAVAPTLTAIAGSAMAGDLRAAEMVLAITGRYDPKATEAQNAMQVVMTIVDSVIKHVDDPKVRANIMADVGLSATALETARGQLNA